MVIAVKYENLFEPDCIRTMSGIYINVLNPKPEMIDIRDIAHSLSNQCRFGGHLSRFFSVGQHSLNCSYMTSQPNKLAALLHDASEAYLMDIPSPIKKHLTNYKEIEDGLMKVIAEKFGFEYPLNEEVKRVDAQMLQAEWDGLMLEKENGFKAHNQWQVYRDFLDMYKFYSTPI